MITVLNGAILGVIQGLCEFLPVSSSGHLLLARFFLGVETELPGMKLLDIILHVGTLIPVLLVFWKDWIQMIAHPVKNKTLLLLIVASLPTLAIYMLAKKLFPAVNGFSVFDNGWFLGVSFLITAIFLLIADRVSASSRRRAEQPSFLHALVMGIFQGIGMIPGVSRSGSTITGGVITGLSKSAAAKFSFMMSAPAIVGSLLMESKDALEEGYFGNLELVPTAVGFVCAMVCGFLAIRLMLRLIQKVPMGWFALYVAVIGVIYLVLQLSGSSLLPPFAVPSAAEAVQAVPIP